MDGWEDGRTQGAGDGTERERSPECKAGNAWVIGRGESAVCDNDDQVTTNRKLTARSIPPSVDATPLALG